MLSIVLKLVLVGLAGLALLAVLRRLRVGWLVAVVLLPVLVLATFASAFIVTAYVILGSIVFCTALLLYVIVKALTR
jgi:hypothetical protein